MSRAFSSRSTEGPSGAVVALLLGVGVLLTLFAVPALPSAPCTPEVEPSTGPRTRFCSETVMLGLPPPCRGSNGTASGPAMDTHFMG